MKNDTRIDNKKYGLPADAKVWCTSHPVLLHKLTKLRDERTDSTVFRHVLREVTFYLGYEATADLDTAPKVIKTPLGEHKGAELTTSVAVVPILRAGLGMVDAMLDLLPNAAVHHIGMYRNKHSLLPVQYYNKLPKECNADVAIVLEPVIATAGTIIATVAILKTWGVPKIKIISAVASQPGLQDLFSKHPDVEVIVAAVDEALTEDGYIFPGLGDAGDRQFHTGAHAEDHVKKQKFKQNEERMSRSMDEKPQLRKMRSKDPLESSWRTHMKDGQWVPDVAVAECMLCRGEFSFWNRKHHCRRCGAVVCDPCSGSRTRFIHKEISPDRVANEDCRVCDGCIKVIDEKLALGLSKRFGKGANSDAMENNQDEAAEQPKTLPPSEPKSNRGVLTVGRYRAEIKESEGNRYIRDNDL